MAAASQGRCDGSCVSQCLCLQESRLETGKPRLFCLCKRAVPAATTWAYPQNTLPLGLSVDPGSRPRGGAWRGSEAKMPRFLFVSST